MSTSEEQECMNVWTAYLNFETHYGSQLQVDEVLRQAQLKVDPVAIQRRLCDIYARAGKLDVSHADDDGDDWLWWWYTVGRRKTCRLTFVHIFASYSPIFKILSVVVIIVSQHTVIASLPCEIQIPCEIQM